MDSAPAGVAFLEGLRSLSIASSQHAGEGIDNLLPTYYDEEYVCNNAYEVVTSTDHIPDQTDEDSDCGYPMFLGPFAAQDLNCGYVPQGLTPGDVHCGTQVLTCLELDALHALGYPGYTCGDTEFYMQAWCPMAD
ncbi:hypothetical protein PHISP_04060 [Aspergillus sp. HF37]|nr:hypothetical protein PHISP_04060 [Aspergillus sp. HF37]